MKRVLILCEGQTEEQFVNRVLGPYFYGMDIYLTPIILTTKQYANGLKERGGVSSYEKIKKQLQILCKDTNAYVTSMLDYFRLPMDTPCMNDPHQKTIDHVLVIENAIDEDVGLKNCHTNLMLHEFEALLFSEPSAFQCVAGQKMVDEISAVRSMFETPEDINSSPETAPSKRIIALKPDYRKVVQGVSIAEKIGIDKMIQCCPHFSAWIENIKN